MYNEWLETKKEFRGGLILSSIMVFALLIWPGNKIDTSQENFIRETVILQSKPFFDEESHGKSGTEHFVKLNFTGDKREYRITGIDYNFLRYDDFIQIDSGDTLEIARTSNKIHSLSKNGFNYLNYTKAETNRGLVIYFIGYLFIPIIPICIFVQFFKKRPYYRYKNKLYPIQFDIITFIIFTATIIILTLNMPHFQIISSGEFYK
ncbi:hypothetical protein GON26_03285 [Flavobacterium sp. GA093]|uniref:Uncharacterized protein n=1 Tax=Flavobacterium hydrocarbonoxydans TaxID=2683249 RepID=A0A6I4NNW6_9FLAO|nr:hypothetical protein [Flavobacterium hydrocarbonoxydans]MWB93369.1 hypothetical protein [Flavobacterium hydrocarbonoxydans]